MARVHWKRSTKAITVAVSRLRHNPGLLVLWDEDDSKVALRYARLMQKGVAFPPLEVFTMRGHPGKFFVADGNHRLYAIRRLGLKKVPVLIY